MKNLTEKQQQIVDSLIEEFAEINKVEADKADNDFDGWNDPQDEVINWRKGFEPIFKAAAAETRSKVRTFLESQRKNIAGYISAAGKHSESFNFDVFNTDGQRLFSAEKSFTEGDFPDKVWDRIVEAGCDVAVCRLAKNHGVFNLFTIQFGYISNGYHKMACVVHGNQANADFENHLKIAPIKNLKSPLLLRDITSIYFLLNGIEYDTPKDAYNNDNSLRVAIGNVVMQGLKP